MESESIKLDEDGIPVLEDAVAPQQATAPEPPPAVDLTDQEQVEQLLQNEDLQQAVEDLTEDLQKLVTWKIESLLKEELYKLIQEAAAKSAPQVTEDIRTQLKLALPDLLSQAAMQAKKLDQTP